MFMVDTNRGIRLRGEICGPDGQKAQTALEVERIRDTFHYIIITGDDEALIPAEEIRSYHKITNDDYDGIPF